MWTFACILLAFAATPPSTPVVPPRDDGPRYSSEEALRHYGAARLFEENGDGGAALGEYYRILISEPDAVEVLVRASELTARLGDTGRSLELAERALRAEPDNPRALWLRGSALFNQGRAPESLGDLERASALDTSKVEYARSLARAAESQERIDLVAIAYHRVVEMDWEDDESWFQLAAAEARLGHFEQARWALDEATDDRSDRPGAKFLEGWIDEGLGRRDAAIAAYGEHLKSHPSDQLTRSRLVHLLAAEGRWGEALPHARRVSEEAPGSIDALEDVAEISLRAGRRDEAEHALDAMNRLAPDSPDVLSRRMDVLVRNKRAPDALEIAHEWAQRHPGNLRGALAEARAQAVVGPPARAIEVATRLVALAPDSLAPRILLGKIYQTQKRWDDALGVWNETLRRFPDQVGVTLDLAFCHQERGDTTRSEQVVRDLLRRRPDEAEALNFLGYLLAEANRNLDEALALIRRALDFQPENGAYVDSMGWVLFRLGRYAEARKELERAADLTGGDAVVLEHLGDVYRALELTALAREQYRKALAADRGNTRVRTKLDRLP